MIWQHGCIATVTTEQGLIRSIQTKYAVYKKIKIIAEYSEHRS